MYEMIKCCSRCNLCKNQRPIIDENKDCKVFWVGLSSKQSKTNDEKPLASTTVSGRIITQVEKLCSNIPMYKTNIVKCLPLDETGKLRYPNRDEIDLCISNFGLEIDDLSPRVVFLLGNIVTQAVERYLGIKFEPLIGFNYIPIYHREIFFIPIQHPSYIYVYRRRSEDEYIRKLEETIYRYIL